MDVKKQEAAHQPPEHRGAQKAWVGSWLLLAVLAVGLYFLINTSLLHLPPAWAETGRKMALAAACGFAVLAVARGGEGYLSRHTHSRAAQYNLVRLIRLLSILLVVFIFVSFLFTHWYAAAVSLGLFSLILGFALQTPISSFIGWLYIILRNPYRVGDRIQLDVFKGDVVEIGYLDTTIWEFGGDYMTSDLPTGRLIRFPNSMVFSAAVYNYSWRRFPYIWNEIPFHIAYESDFGFVAETLRREAKAILGDGLEAHVEHLKQMISETAIDQLEIKDYPFVTFRTNANTWVEATLVYLVPPRQSSAVRTQILKACIAALLKQPDSVLFPKGNSR